VSAFGYQINFSAACICAPGAKTTRLKALFDVHLDVLQSAQLASAHQPRPRAVGGNGLRHRPRPNTPPWRMAGMARRRRWL